MACLGGFLTGREAAKRMSLRGRGTIIFTGATACLRGGSGFSRVSGAKAGLRMLAQSMARELGPQGIHVAHTVIDGAIDTEVHQGPPSRFRQCEGAGPDPQPRRHRRKLCDAATSSPKARWTHELDLRPRGEKW